MVFIDILCTICIYCYLCIFVLYMAIECVGYKMPRQQFMGVLLGIDRLSIGTVLRLHALIPIWMNYTFLTAKSATIYSTVNAKTKPHTNACNFCYCQLPCAAILYNLFFYSFSSLALQSAAWIFLLRAYIDR